MINQRKGSPLIGAFGLPGEYMQEMRANLGIPSIADYQRLAARMGARGAGPHTRNQSARMLPFILQGQACSYGQLIQHSRAPEPHRLQPGCFQSSLHSVPLLDDHRGPTIIKILKFADTPTGLYFHARIPDTEAGRDLVDRVKSSPSESVSVSIDGLPERTISRELNGVEFNDVLFANLRHIAVVGQGADPDARAWLVAARN